MAPKGQEEVELSVVMPCLNETETVGACVRAARDVLKRHGITAEILVADNGSSDDSSEVAVREGARVVVVPERGYGSALMGAIAVSHGRYVFMADADGSYDFQEIPRFLS